MTTDATPGATGFLPTFPGLPLMKTRALTPMATTLSTRPSALTLRVELRTGPVAEGVGVGEIVGFGLGVEVGLDFTVGVGLAVGEELGFGLGVGLTIGFGP